MKKKGEFSMEQILSLVIVVLVIIAALLMFFSKGNLLNYLQVIPGYQVPGSGEIVAGEGKEVPGEGSCTTERVAIQVPRKDVGRFWGTLEQLWPWKSILDPVYIKDSKDYFVDYGLSLEEDNLIMKVKSEEFVVGEVDERGILRMEFFVFEANSKFHQKLRLNLLLEGKKYTVEDQGDLISSFLKIEEAKVEPSIVGNVINNFCRGNDNFLEGVEVDSWSESNDTVETIELTLKDFEAEIKRSKAKTVWNWFLGVVNFIPFVEIEIESSSHYIVDIPDSIYSGKNSKGIIDKWGEMLVVKHENAPTAAILSDGSIWIARSRGLHSKDVAFNEVVILYFKSSSKQEVLTSLSFNEERFHFFETNLRFKESDFKFLKAQLEK